MTLFMFDVLCERLDEKMVQDSVYTQIYGSITITNKSLEVRHYSINQFTIVAGTSKRSEVYYDSKIDYLVTDQLIAPREELRIAVCWGFVGTLGKGEVDSLKLAAF